MTDALPPDLPPALAERLAEYDAEIARLAAEEADLSAQINAAGARRLRYLTAREALLDAAEICRAAWCDNPEHPRPTELPAVAELTAPVHKRRRRDIRGEVLDLVRLCGPITERDIAQRLGVRASQAGAALQYHADARRIDYRIDGYFAPVAQQEERGPSKAEAEGSSPSGCATDDPTPSGQRTDAEVLDFIRRCGDMGAGAFQLRHLGATSEQIADLIERGEIRANANDRYLIAPDPTP